MTGQIQVLEVLGLASDRILINDWAYGDYGYVYWLCHNIGKRL